ncbi:PTS sugar transporter subunit IIC [Mammaliicoccus sciuri]|uniref:PTS sugar transporter subunit IIC n=1 Tax=Mammaliicoccus sciuri TaxID=1296 RepID=UPI003F69009D
MMIPVYFKNPIIAVPLIINGLMSGLLTYFVGIKGTPMSTGFGYTGFVGPANALKFMEGSSILKYINTRRSIFRHTVCICIYRT